MQNRAVISVEDLGKVYTIGHQAEPQRYVALRDVIAHRIKSVLTPRSRQEGGVDPKEDFWALRNLSFEVKHGEVIGIIGRNGAGKSTLLKILSRITEPSNGRARIKGRVASLLEVGTGFHPELTGRENVFLNGAILGMSRDEIKSKFDEIVSFADVEKFLDTPVKHYSSGMYVRLAFAVAAHLEPEILIVDEVLSVGDAEFQKKCLGKIGDVAQEGRTVLFVSHNLNTIERLCSRVLHLQRGRLAGDYLEPRRGISAYLRGDSEQSNFVWRNSGKEFQNSVFLPQSMEVASDNPKWRRGEPISNDFPILVFASGIICTNDPALNIGIGVYDEDGSLMFWSFIKDVPEADWPESHHGATTYKVSIPARLLNEGEYKIELLAGLHCRNWSLAPEVFAPAVHFTIRGGLSESPLWNSRRPGKLAPVIPWQRVREIGSDQSGTLTSSASMSPEQPILCL